jgi:hypothetical protein
MLFLKDEKVGLFTHVDRNLNGKQELPVETLAPLPISPSCLRARINQRNRASLALFSSLGFVVVRPGRSVR